MHHNRRRVAPVLLLAVLLCALLVPATTAAFGAEMTGTITLAGGSTVTSSTVVPVTSAVDPAPTEMRFGNGDSWTDWGPYAPSAEVTVPAGDGLKVVTGEFRDAETSMTTSAMITLDTVAPLGDFAVAADAPYTTSPSVIVDFNPLLETPVAMRFSVDDGATWTAWSAYAPTRALTLPGPDGTKTVRAEYRDGAGNVAAVSDSIVLDTTGPTGTMTLNGGAALTNNRNASIDSMMTDATEMAVSVDGGATFGGWAAYADHVAAQLPSGPDGTRSVVVRYRDAMGNVSERSDSIILDTAPPLTNMSVAPAAPDGLNGWYVSTPTVTLSSEQGASIRFKWSPAAGWMAYASPLPVAEGTPTLYYAATDAAGNAETTHSVSFKVDLTNPAGTFALANGASQTATTAVSGDFTPSGEAPAEVRFSTDGGTTWTPWATYTASYALRLPAGDGTKTVKAEYRDAAGNVLVASDSIVLDTTGPTGTMTLNGGAAATGVRTVSVDSTVAGAADMAVSVDGGTTFAAWSAYAPHVNVTLPVGPDGQRTVVVRYRDSLGNVTELSDAITLDTTSPLTSMSVTPAAPDGLNGWYVSTPTVTLSSEQGAAIRYKWTAAAGWTSYASPLTVAEGTRTLYYSATDALGNVEPTHTVSFKVDLTDPAGTFALANGASQTATTAVSGDFTPSGEPPAEMRFSTDGGTTWTSWATYASSYALRLPAGDGTKTVKAEYRDGAGNVLAASDSIILDTNGPTGTMTLNGGAAATNVRTVSVDSTIAGAVDMAVSVDGGTTFAAWGAYNAHIGVTLLAGADGPRTVVVRYRDALGNVTELSDSITLDTTAAKTTADAAPAAPDGENGWYVNRPSITLGADETGAAIRYKWAPADAWSPYSSPFQAPEGQSTLYFSSIDAAGNVEPTATASFKVDLTGPTGTTAVNGGASYATTTAASLDSAVTAATLMRVNVGGTWPTQWEAYAAHKAITLPSTDGARVVTAQFKDVAGNIHEAGDTILLDRAAPTAVSVNATAVAGTTTIRATLGASDAVSGVNGYSVLWTTNAAAVPLAAVNAPGAAVTVTSPSMQVGVDNYCVVRAVDKAGNWSAPKVSAKVRFPYPPVKITKAGFSNPVAYELRSLLYTNFTLTTDQSGVDVLLTVTRPDRTKLTLVNKKGVTPSATTPILYKWNGLDAGKRLPSASYDWELSVTKNGVTTKKTGKLLICKITFSWKGTSVNKAWTTGTGYMQPGAANCYIQATTTAPGTDSMYMEITDPYGYRVTAGPVNFTKALPLNATMRLNSTTGTQITSRSVHTFKVRNNTTYSMPYTFTVIQ